MQYQQAQVYDREGGMVDGPASNAPNMGNSAPSPLTPETCKEGAFNQDNKNSSSDIMFG
jgi:hypothetical protein